MFGTIGSGGMIVLIVLALWLHKRGGGRIKPVKSHHVIYWGAALGWLCASAGEALSRVAAISDTFGQALSAQSGMVGPIGAGAIALALILIGFGTDPSMGKDLVIGVALPGALSTAGGVLAIPVVVGGSLLHGLGA